MNKTTLLILRLHLLFSLAQLIIKAKKSTAYETQSTYINNLNNTHNQSQLYPTCSHTDCGTGRCHEFMKGGLIHTKCICPQGHTQDNDESRCKGVNIGLFGYSDKCTDGIKSGNVTAINLRTLLIEDFRCNDRIHSCQHLLHHAYFIAEMGSRQIKLKTIHQDQCTHTALPGLYPFTIYLEFPEDQTADSMYSLILHDIEMDNVLTKIDLDEDTRDKIAELEHPDKLKCHYHSDERVEIGKFGFSGKCIEGIRSAEVMAINSRVLKVFRFECDENVNDCHELLELSYFVGRKGSNHAFLHTIVHEKCRGFSLPPLESRFTLFLELPHHQTLAEMDSLLLQHDTSKKIHCRIDLKEHIKKRIADELPVVEKSRCHQPHEELSKLQ